MSIFPVIVGTVLFVAVMVICGAFILIRHRRWKASWIEAEAHVVRLEGAREGEPVRGKRAWPVIDYRDVAGEPHQVRLSERVAVKTTSKGDRLKIFYRADRPYAPRLDSAGEVWAAWLSFAMAGASTIWLVVQIVTRV